MGVVIAWPTHPDAAWSHWSCWLPSRSAAQGGCSWWRTGSWLLNIREMADISGGPPICEGWVCGILGGSYGPAVPGLMICADLKLEELETLECSWWHTCYGLERLEQGRQWRSKMPQSWSSLPKKGSGSKLLWWKRPKKRPQDSAVQGKCNVSHTQNVKFSRDGWMASSTQWTQVWANSGR